MTYNVFGGTLSLTQSINQPQSYVADLAGQQVCTARALRCLETVKQRPCVTSDNEIEMCQ